jgi:hypothetical protein
MCNFFDPGASSNDSAGNTANREWFTAPQSHFSDTAHGGDWLGSCM